MIAGRSRPSPSSRTHAELTGKVGAVGFCFGGGVVNRLATDSTDARRRRAYYGAQPPADKVPAIKAPLLLQYAETDENINKGIDGLRGGAEGQQQEVHASTSIRARSTPSTTTPTRRATTRRRPTSPGRAVAFFSSTSASRRASAERAAERSTPRQRRPLTGAAFC